MLCVDYRGRKHSLDYFKLIENPPTSRGGRIERAALGTEGGRGMSSTRRKRIKTKDKKGRIRKGKGMEDKGEIRRKEAIIHWLI